MINAKGYAAKDPQADLAPWDFQLREVGPHDVQIRIMYCGVCHTDLHQIRVIAPKIGDIERAR